MAILPKGFPVFSRPKAAFRDWGFPSKRVLTSKRYACSIIAAAIYVSFSLLKRSFFERKCNLIDADVPRACVCICDIVMVFLLRGGIFTAIHASLKGDRIDTLEKENTPNGCQG